MASTVRSIRLSHEDDKRVSDMAAKAGLTVPEYIRQQALVGQVESFDLSPVVEHTRAVCEIVAAARELTKTPHDDKWMYEEELLRITELLTELLDAETALMASLRPGEEDAEDGDGFD